MSSTNERVAFRVLFMASYADLQKVAVMAQELPKEIRKKIVRKGLRDWGEAVLRTIKSGAHRKAKRTKRDLAVKTKTYRRGRIWAGVGVRKDGNRVGWRSHLYDGGWRPIQKGFVMSQDGTLQPKPIPKLKRNWKGNKQARIVPFSQNRGWRSGVRRSHLGNVIYKLGYIRRAAIKHQSRVSQYVRDAIDIALMEARRGR